jgi:hypothetical protein
MAEEHEEPTEQATKQRKKRERETARNAVPGMEKLTVEVAGVFKPGLKRVMQQHGINNQRIAVVSRAEFGRTGARPRRSNERYSVIVLSRGCLSHLFQASGCYRP